MGACSKEEHILREEEREAENDGRPSGVFVRESAWTLAERSKMTTHQ